MNERQFEIQDLQELHQGARLTRAVSAMLLVLVLIAGNFGLAPVLRAQTVDSPKLALGVNVNEDLPWLRPDMLTQSGTTWVRGFVPASEFIDGKRLFETDAGLQALKVASQSGHKVILSIKWDCKAVGGLGPVPSAGSAAEHKWFAFVDNLLDATAGQLSILVVNNELFIDAVPQDLSPMADGQVPMVAFLKRLVDHIHSKHPKSENRGPLPLYVGGFTRLDKAEMQSAPATAQMLKLINDDQAVTGGDFHMHQPDMQSSLQAMTFMHTNVLHKPLIVTEFSLVWKWKEHLNDQIGLSPSGKEFARQYGLDPHMTVVDFCNRAYAHPVPEAEWNAFAKSQPWFETNYLKKMGVAMESAGIVTATYAFTLDPNFADRPARVLTDSISPWYLNQLLIPGLAYVPGGTRAPTNEIFFADFSDWQRSKQ